MIIYSATNKINEKKYIGQTVGSLKRRKSDHIWASLNKKSNIYFHRAIRKYGKNEFVWKILHRCNNINFLNRLEIFYIGYYDTFNNGYNLTEGGGGMLGCIPSKETLQKRSEAAMGHIVSIETRQKIAKGNTGKHPSKKTRRKMSEAKLGRIGKDCVNYGKHHTDEAKRKMSEARKGKYCGKDSHMFGKTGKAAPSGRKVKIGNKQFYTVRDAEKTLKVCHDTVRRRILHKTKWLDYSYVEEI